MELGNYTNILYTTIKNTPLMRNEYKEAFKKDYYELKQQLLAYIRSVTKSNIIIPSQNYAIQLLQFLQDSQKMPLDVLTFNYTDTMERIADCAPTPIRKDSLHIFHVHGSISDDIVFGVDDGQNLEREEAILYKSYSRSKKIRVLAQLLESYTNVVYFGYSLGWTDRQYFQSYFSSLTKDKVKPHNITFYHYGEEAYLSLKYQLQLFTAHELSRLEMLNNIEFIDCQNDEFQKPSFLKD